MEYIESNMMHRFKYMLRMSQITNHIFLSNWNISQDFNKLEKNNIKTIITINTVYKPQSILDKYKENGITHHMIELDDNHNENIEKYFESTSNIIQKSCDKKENILVHCTAGISRSASIIIAYLIQKSYQIRKNEKLVYPVILKMVKKERPIIQPNPGFERQLLHWEALCKAKYSSTRNNSN